MCGGLGPTHDDITRESIAEVMGVELAPDEAVAEFIRELFARRGRYMADNNLRQALVPVGATVIPQTRGTAPGLICPVGERVVYAVPGVPHEMREMLERAVIPDLRARSGEQGVIRSRVLRTWGESESGLNERLQPIIDELDTAGNPTLAFLASGWEGMKVRLTAKAVTIEAADALIDGWDARIRAEVGAIVFGVDDETMESVVLDRCRALGYTLGIAESVSGGLVGGRLTGIAGASDVFRGSIVTYASDVDGARCAAGTRRVGRAFAHRGGWPSGAGWHAGRHLVRRYRVAGRFDVRDAGSIAGPARSDAPDERHHGTRRTSPRAHPRCRVTEPPATEGIALRGGGRVANVVPSCLRSSMDRASGFYPAGWGFESLRRRATGENLLS
jgi:molybdopterin-biosynthesis enzyme MoeA-like protein